MASRPPTARRYSSASGAAASAAAAAPASASRSLPRSCARTTARSPSVTMRRAGPASSCASEKPSAPASGFLAVLVEALGRAVPLDHLHEGVDVGGGLGAVVHVIGVLVHVEHQDRPAAGDRVRAIGRPAVDHALVLRRGGQDGPA